MIPTLSTQRLTLRPFTSADADEVVRLAGAREVAATTLLIPHPYQKSDALAWIATHEPEFARSARADFAISLHDGTLIGAIGLSISATHNHADIGYWIGVPYWGHGYATEAGREIIRYGFQDRALNRLTAHHFAGNLASGRVIQKMGLKQEGLFRQHVKKWGTYTDAVMYGILRSEWQPPR